MKYTNNNKGQVLVEFAILLAFVTVIGIYGQKAMHATSALFTPTKIILAEINHHRDYDVAKSLPEISAIKEHYKEGNSANKADWQRGMVRSGWVERNAIDYPNVTAATAQNDNGYYEIKNLFDEVGAKQWSYLTGVGKAVEYTVKDENGKVVKDENGNNLIALLYTDDDGKEQKLILNYEEDPNATKKKYTKGKGNYLSLEYQRKYYYENGDLNYQYAVNNTNKDAGMYAGDQGLFWTIEDLEQSMLTLTDDRPATSSVQEKYNYSNELVLQYFYSEYTKKYYVIKSFVWVNQYDLSNSVALAGFRQQYYKPAGYFVEGCTEGFSTLGEAKELFEKVREANNWSVVFAKTDIAGNEGANIKPDTPAGNYVLNSTKTAFVEENQYKP